MANICNDLSKSAVKNTGPLKMLTGEDSIPAEEKMKPGFEFENRAKLIFSTNDLPPSSDDSEAFFRRWLIVNFPHRFTENRDTDLIDKLTSPEELSGVLNWALEGLKRLLDKKHFSNSKSTEETREFYKRSSNPISAFFLDILNSTKDEVDIIPKKEVYEKYMLYCKKHDLTTVAYETFCRKLKQEIPGLSDGQNRVNGKMTWCWHGIKIKQSEGKEDEENRLF